MIEFVVAAPASGSGKTVVACAMLAAFKRQGLSPCAFKCGPDYIDPIFHRAVLGLESCNLDLFLAKKETVRGLYARHCAGHGAAVCEGVMGFYDGLAGASTRASTWQVADTLGLPVLLVLRPKGTSLTLAALVRGLCGFVPNSRIAGIFLNDCTPALYRMLAPMLRQNTGLPVLGYLPPMPQARFESRHLGLRADGGIGDLRQRMEALADMLMTTVDWERLKAAFAGRPRACAEPARRDPEVRIAVARDEAFYFTYAETLESLCRAGAEPVFFSPLREPCLPARIGGLYLLGGYPELYARELAQNASMRAEIRRAVTRGMPTVAECGGFLYLGKSLQDETGNAFPMAGALPGDGVRTEKPVRFGYAELTAREDSLLFRKGEKLPVHEFHYWDSTENGAAFEAKKPVGKRRWPCGFATSSLYAAFPHLYFAGRPQLARRFVTEARQYFEREAGYERKNAQGKAGVSCAGR